MGVKSWPSRYPSIVLLQRGRAVGHVDQGGVCNTERVKLLVDCPKRPMQAVVL